MSDARVIEHIAGTAIPVSGNNIDTDRIIHARFMQSITFDGLGDHVFEDDRQSMPNHPFSNSSYAGASILLANENFGSGSSREHAPQALKRWGIDACIGESFSEIFLGNATPIGLPCATASAADITRVMDVVEEVPVTRFSLRIDTLVVESEQFSSSVLIPAAIQASFLSGQWDATGLLLDQFDDVRQIAAALPYVKGY